MTGPYNLINDICICYIRNNNINSESNGIFGGTEKITGQRTFLMKQKRYMDCKTDNGK